MFQLSGFYCSWVACYVPRDFHTRFVFRVEGLPYVKSRELGRQLHLTKQGESLLNTIARYNAALYLP